MSPKQFGLTASLLTMAAAAANAQVIPVNNGYTLTVIGVSTNNTIAATVAGINVHGQVAGTVSGWSKPGTTTAFLNNSWLIEPLNAPPGSSDLRVTALSANKIVGCGNFPPNGYEHAWVNSGLSVIDINPALGMQSSCAGAVNDAGVVGVVGTAYDGSRHTFRYQFGTATEIKAATGISPDLSAINSSGVMAGILYLGGGTQIAHAAISRAGQWVDLGTLGGTNSDSTAINSSGQVAGDSQTAAGVYHAFILQSGHMVDLGTLGGPNSYAVAVNDAGQITGSSDTATGATHAFVSNGSIMMDISPNQSVAFPWAINASGEVVGEMDTPVGPRHGFLYTKGKLIDLNSLLPPAVAAKYTITSGEWINDLGQIAGFANINEASGPYAISFILSP